MTTPEKTTNDLSVKSKLITLIDYMSEEMQIKLLKFLEEKLNITVTGDLKIEKRGNNRRSCLIFVDYIIQGNAFKSYILDVSAFGVFIETNESFPVGHDISMTFSLPNHKKPFNLDGKIVWSGSQGFGVKFNYLPPRQKDLIKSFSEKTEDVYDITS